MHLTMPSILKGFHKALSSPQTFSDLATLEYRCSSQQLCLTDVDVGINNFGLLLAIYQKH